MNENGQYDKNAIKKNVFWKNAEIPIIIGVSAHRNIRKEHEDRVKRQVREVLENIRELCPHSPIRMVSGLAYGGDMLCARVAAELGIELVVALPFAEEEYVNEVDFPRGSDREYFELRNGGNTVDCFVVPDMAKVEHSPTDRDYLFRQQSIYVATNSHVLLALWDGTDATEYRSECGTNAAVGFALKQNYYQQNGMEFCPAPDGAVIKIFSPRDTRTYGEISEADTAIKYLLPRDLVREVDDDVIKHMQKASDDEREKRNAVEQRTQDTRDVGEEKPRRKAAYYAETTEMPRRLKDVFWHTDRYNKDYLEYCAKLKSEQSPRSGDFLMERVEYDNCSPKCRAIHDCHSISSALSSRNKKRNLHALMLLATIGMLLLLSFMVYDQLSFLWTVAVCLGMVVVLVLAYVFAYTGERKGGNAKRKVYGRIKFDVHSRFIEYRALSEAMRVQYYMALYGISESVCRYFTWSHKSIMPWVRKAVIALSVGSSAPIWENPVMAEHYEKSETAPKIIDSPRTDAQGVFENKMLGKWAGQSKYIMDKNDNGQLGYHLQNISDKSKSIKRRNAVKKTAVIVTLITYLTLFLCELLPFVDLGKTLFWVVNMRMILKGTITAFTAITFLVSYYYGKQSLDQIQADSVNMVNLYRVALDRANVIYRTSDKPKVCDAAFRSLVCELAREQLIENVTWVAYNRDNNIEMPL